MKVEFTWTTQKKKKAVKNCNELIVSCITHLNLKDRYEDFYDVCIIWTRDFVFKLLGFNSVNILTFKAIKIK